MALVFTCFCFAEHHLKHRRQILSQSGSPVDIVLVQIHARLEGLWVYGANCGMGDFCILAYLRLQKQLVWRVQTAVG